MEHQTDLQILSERTGIDDNSKLSMLIDYAKLIFSENKKYNLTGHKTLSEIIENLIIGSLEPVKNMNVPRGTLFADIGTGAGIPGMPLAIKYSESEGILFDSNQKKIRFINNTVSILGLTNVKGIDTRIEDACRLADYREKFDMVFTRAMSDVYTIAELGSPLLKCGGSIFLYINKDQMIIDRNLSEHIIELGLITEIMSYSETASGDEIIEGFLLKKTKATDDKYPRRMPVIKRMAAK